MSIGTSKSPYGDAWNMLWFGHCRVGPSEKTPDVHFLSNDSTVPPVGRRHSYWASSHVLPQILSNNTRSVFKAQSGMCTYTYAITYEGARKVLTSLSLLGDSHSFDAAMSFMCLEAHVHPFPCYGIYPPIFSSHRFAGSKNRDSDIKSSSTATHPEFTQDIVYSVIQNAASLLSGEKMVKSQ